MTTDEQNPPPTGATTARPSLSTNSTVIAIESSQVPLSVGVRYRGDRHCFQLDADQPQAEYMLTAVEDCLHAADIELSAIDCGVYSRGPGSFTSIRIGLAFLMALKASRHTPLYGVSSLAALAYRAQQLSHARTVLVCLDARGSEVYCGAYRFDGQTISCQLPDSLLDPRQLNQPALNLFRRSMTEDGTTLVGDGWLRHLSVLRQLSRDDRVEQNASQASELRATADDLMALLTLPNIGHQNIVGREDDLLPSYMRDGL